MKFTLIILIIFYLPAQAQQAKETPTMPEDIIRDQQIYRWNKMKKESNLDGTRGAFDNLAKDNDRLKNRHNLMGIYSFLDTWIPSKLGLSYTYNLNENKSYELEYLRGKVSVPLLIDDIGSIKEERLNLNYRSFQGRESFHVIYGLNYNSFKINLGSEFLAGISGSPLSYKAMEVKTLGASIGLGNRWQHKNKLVYGIDWFVMNLPLITLKEDTPFLEQAAGNNKDEVKDVVSFLKKLPTFSLFKVQVGLSF